MDSKLSLSSSSKIGVRIAIPALFTQISICSAACSNSAKQLFTDYLSDTSMWIALALLSSAAQSFNVSSLRAANKTRSPAPDRQRTHCSPRPLKAPVINAVLPFRSNSWIFNFPPEEKIISFPPLYLDIKLHFVENHNIHNHVMIKLFFKINHFMERSTFQMTPQKSTRFLC